MLLYIAVRIVQLLITANYANMKGFAAGTGHIMLSLLICVYFNVYFVCSYIFQLNMPYSMYIYTQAEVLLCFVDADCIYVDYTYVK